MSNGIDLGNASIDVANEHRREVIKWRAEIETLESDLKSKAKIEARIYDLYINNDLFRSLIDKQVDTIIGSKVILQCNPDYKALGVTAAEAKEWSKIVERKFHEYANCEENWISSNRNMNFLGLVRAACKSEIMTGEIIASREWRPSPLGYKTCINLISSNRLKTPTDKKDKVFYGIELDRYGASLAFHIESHDIRKSIRSSGVASVGAYAGAKGKTIKRFSKYNAFGWLQIFHIYEPFKPEYPRGISRLTATLIKVKQLARYFEADLDKAIIATSYVYAISSDEDPDSVADMLSGVDSMGSVNGFGAEEAAKLPPEMQRKRDEIMQKLTDRHINVTGGQVLHLFKDEKIEVLGAPNTIQSSDSYGKGHARAIAGGAGISYELGTGDLEGVNFSGAQMSLGIYEHSANIKRQIGPYKFATMVFRAWLDEAIDKEEVPLLGNKPYWPNKERYARSNFSGVKRVHLDPVKKANSDMKGLKNLTKSRTQISNDDGDDFEVLTQQRADEARDVMKSITEVLAEYDIKPNTDALSKVALEIIAGNSVETPEQVSEIDAATLAEQLAESL